MLKKSTRFTTFRRGRTCKSLYAFATTGTVTSLRREFSRKYRANIFSTGLKLSVLWRPNCRFIHRKLYNLSSALNASQLASSSPSKEKGKRGKNRRKLGGEILESVHPDLDATIFCSSSRSFVRLSMLL